MPHPDDFITLDYHPAAHLLVASMPDIRQVAAAQASLCLELITKNVRSHEVHYLLLDASNAIQEVEEESYKALLKDFSLELMTTCLKKVARVGSQDNEKEKLTTQIACELKAELNLPLQYRQFDSVTEAIAWLEEE